MTETTAVTTKGAQAPPSEASSKQPSKEQSWRTLGHYAVGELSVGHTHNALYAYRILIALEPGNARWRLGRAFCALNLRQIAEAQNTLAAFAEDTLLPTSARQQRLLRQCRERLAYLQQQKTTPITTPQPPERKPANKGKVLPFPQVA